MRSFALALLCVLLFPLPPAAAQRMEIIGLKHRDAAEVAAALRPLLDEDGRVSALGGKLMVRTSEANLKQIRAALAALDVPARRLRITVVQDDGRVAGAGTWRSHAGERHSQQVQVIEGGQAFVAVGRSLPLPLRQIVVGPDGVAVSEGIVWRDLGTGFYAAPRLQGDRVTLEISPQQASEEPGQPGAVRGARLVTTASGRLGEWIELGASAAEAREDGAGSRWSSRGSLQQLRVRLMVEELP